MGEPTSDVTVDTAAASRITISFPAPLEEYARDRLKSLMGKELSRGTRALTAAALGFAARAALPLSDQDHAFVVNSIQAVATALPVVAGIGLRKLGENRVTKAPESTFWRYFQKIVAWLPL